MGFLNASHAAGAVVCAVPGNGGTFQGAISSNCIVDTPVCGNPYTSRAGLVPDVSHLVRLSMEKMMGRLMLANQKINSNEYLHFTSHLGPNLLRTRCLERFLFSRPHLFIILNTSYFLSPFEPVRVWCNRNVPFSIQKGVSCYLS